MMMMMMMMMMRAVLLLVCAAGVVACGSPPAAPPGDGPLTFEQTRALVDAYRATHGGNGGQDWDINAEAQPDADAQRLLSICAADQRPVIPSIAWEHGGNDHRWVSPEVGALAYCVYIPTSSSVSAHWRYDPAADHVVADVWVTYPDQNPCADRAGADQIAGCIGDASNFEILIDIANFRDGRDAGLALAEATSELDALLPDGTRALLVDSR